MIEIYCFKNFDIEKIKVETALFPQTLRQHIDNKPYPNKVISYLGYKKLSEILNKKYRFTLNDIRFNANGKPFLEGNPIYFNITNVKDFIAIAISNDNIGVDVEKIKPFQINVAKKIFDNKTYKLLLKSNNSNSFFCKKFTQKESQIKFLGRTIADFFGKNIICENILTTSKKISNHWLSITVPKNSKDCKINYVFLK